MSMVTRRSAVISECGAYRYSLTRRWYPGGGQLCLFVMLNPSTADASIDDPTIRRCMSFADTWHYGGIVVVNVYAYRATQPADLWRAQDPHGPENRDFINSSLWQTDLTIAAWGNNARKEDALHVYWMLMAERPVYCLGVTGKGFPKHPLYLRKDSTPALYLIAGSDSA
jgi:hypothetical protein